MNSFTLKILACSLMVVDHVAIIFFPTNAIMRLIGRLVFPMFAYMIAEGYRHTKDPASYLGRLFLFALFSQPFYMFGFNYPTIHFNIFFTLTAGLYAIYAYEKSKSYVPLLFAMVVTEVVNASYGSAGVLMIFVMHRFFQDHKRMALWVFVISIFAGIHTIAVKYFTEPNFLLSLPYIAEHAVSGLVQPCAVLAVPIIALYNGKLGINAKYFFYIFYPGHLAVLGLIRMFLGK
jgi:hypothetical protein